MPRSVTAMTAIVGANGLIGSCLARKMKETTMDRLLLIDLNEPIASIFKLLEADSERVSFLQADINQRDQLEAVFHYHPNINKIINCAYPKAEGFNKDFLDKTEKEFSDNVVCQLVGNFNLLQFVSRRFLSDHKPIKLILISSIYGISVPKFNLYQNESFSVPIEYVIAKSGLINAVKYVVKYIDNSQFKVNIVSPGGVRDNHSSEFNEKYARYNLGAGLMSVTDLIPPIIFLLSDDAKEINGFNFIVDNGFSL